MLHKNPSKRVSISDLLNSKFLNQETSPAQTDDDASSSLDQLPFKRLSTLASTNESFVFSLFGSLKLCS